MIIKNIVLNDLLVNYYHWPASNPSSASPQTVIFLHGWRAEGRIWGPVVRSLGKADPALEFYALDLPGFGKSVGEYAGLDPSTLDWKLEDYAASIQDFVEKLTLSSVVLVGHSFGGRIAIKLASQNPKWLRKLVLVDSAGVKLEPRLAFFKKILAKIVKPLFLPKFMQPLRQRIYIWLGAEDYVATPGLTKVFLNVINEDLAPLLPQIKILTLVIWGEADQEVPLWMGRQMNSQIPNSKFQVIKNTGHFCFIDDPDGFTRILNDFIHESD